MNTKLLASIAVFVLLAGALGTPIMQSVYAATYNEATEKEPAQKEAAEKKAMADKAMADKKAMTTGKTTSSSAVTVEMAKGSGSNSSCADKCYIPNTVQIKTGGTVTWKNVDTAAHTVTSGKDATSDGLFDSGMIMAGNSFDHKFDKTGTYDYYCMVHPWMKAKVTVS